MSHVSPGLNVSLSQCLLSQVSGLPLAPRHWPRSSASLGRARPPDAPCQWHATRSSSSRAKPSCSARPVRAPMARKSFAQGKALPKTFRLSKRLCKRPSLPAKTFFNFFQKPPCAQRHDVESLRRLKDQTRFTASLGWLEESPIVRRVPCDPSTKQVEKGSVEKVPSFAVKVTCHAHDPRDESPPITRYVTYRNM